MISQSIKGSWLVSSHFGMDTFPRKYFIFMKSFSFMKSHHWGLVKSQAMLACKAHQKVKKQNLSNYNMVSYGTPQDYNNFFCWCSSGETSWSRASPGQEHRSPWMPLSANLPYPTLVCHPSYAETAKLPPSQAPLLSDKGFLLWVMNCSSYNC